jgi:hypothetical protein
LKRLCQMIRISKIDEAVIEFTAAFLVILIPPFYCSKYF